MMNVIHMISLQFACQKFNVDIFACNKVVETVVVMVVVAVVVVVSVGSRCLALLQIHSS